LLLLICTHTMSELCILPRRSLVRRILTRGEGWRCIF
jgi:hypothetical protein